MSSHLSRTPQNSVASDVFQDPGESQIVAIHDNNNILQPFNMIGQVQNHDIYRFNAPNHLIVNEYRQYLHNTLQNIFIEHNGQTGQRITQLEGWANVENNLVKRLEEKIELLAVWGQERESKVVQLIKVNDQKEKISALENLFQIRDVQLGEFSSRIQEKQIPETQLELQKQQKIIQELSQKVNQCFQQNSSQNNNIQQKKAKVSEEEIKARKARIAELYKNEDKDIVAHINRPYVYHKVKADGNCFYRSLQKCFGYSEDQYMNLKQLVAKWVISNRILVQNIPGVDIQQLILNTQEDYKYAGEAEIRATSDALEMCIIVHQHHQKNDKDKALIYNGLFKVNGILEVIFTRGCNEYGEPILTEQGHFNGLTRSNKIVKEKQIQNNSDKNNNNQNKNNNNRYNNNSYKNKNNDRQYRQYQNHNQQRQQQQLQYQAQQQLQHQEQQYQNLWKSKQAGTYKKRQMNYRKDYKNQENDYKGKNNGQYGEKYNQNKMNDFRDLEAGHNHKIEITRPINYRMYSSERVHIRRIININRIKNMKILFLRLIKVTKNLSKSIHSGQTMRIGTKTHSKRNKDINNE